MGISGGAWPGPGSAVSDPATPRSLTPSPEPLGDSPLKPSRSHSMLSTLLLSPGSAVVSKTYSAAVDRASAYLEPLASLSSRVSLSARGPPGPPPVQISVRRDAPGEDIHLTVAVETSLQQLREGCERATGIPAAHQQLIIEEERPAGDGGLMSALRSTASHLTSRERVVASVSDWVNFMFLPEAVNRELKGRGLAAWAKETILPHLQGPPPPHIAQITVVLLAGRRICLELSHTATVARLRSVVNQTTGVPLERQRLLIVHRPPPHGLAALFWAAARLAYSVACTAASVTSAWARWVVLGPGNNPTMTLKLQTQGGKEVDVAVRRDMTLSQLQQELQLQHGDGCALEGLMLTGQAGSERLSGGEGVKLHVS